MWDRLVQAEPDSIKVYEEGQFLSIIYEFLGVPVGTADPHCRRMWTALRLNNVSAEDVFSSRCVWHLPMEKKTGFANLFKIACRPKSWLWTHPAPELYLPIARVMGIPRRGIKNWVDQIVVRTRFHLEGMAGVGPGGEGARGFPRWKGLLALSARRRTPSRTGSDA